MAVTHFAAIILIVSFFGNSSKGSNKIQTVVGRITQRSTGRQKQARFLPIGKLLVKERYHPKEIPFLLLPPVSLVVKPLKTYSNYMDLEMISISDDLVKGIP